MKITLDQTDDSHSIRCDNDNCIQDKNIINDNGFLIAGKLYAIFALNDMSGSYDDIGASLYFHYCEGCFSNILTQTKKTMDGKYRAFL